MTQTKEKRSAGSHLRSGPRDGDERRAQVVSALALFMEIAWLVAIGRSPLL